MHDACELAVVATKYYLDLLTRTLKTTVKDLLF